MRQPGRARQRGTVGEVRGVYGRVCPKAADLAEVLAVRLEVSKAEFLERLLLHAGDSLDEHGIPTWWNKPLPSDDRMDFAVGT
jgi:hypothetical protein